VTWKKHFKTVNTVLDASAANNSAWNPNSASASKFSSVLPEIYAGHPNRIQRYYQYEDMGRDSDISAALDTIADFCTQSEEQNDEPFLINYLEDPTDTQVKVLKQALKRWVKTNKFKSKIWKMVRDCAQFGDAFFIRDPEDHSWLWVDQFSVEMVKMKADGKQEPEEYVVKNFNPHITEKYGTSVDDMSKYRAPGASQQSTARPFTSSGAQFQIAGSERDVRNRNGMGAAVTTHVSIDAKNMVHLSLNEQMDVNFPFGKSLLDPVFKTYKQKELLEDSILIYRVQRAPERRVFYIDVGSMNGIRAQAYIEGIKNEIHQRRIPNRTGGGNSILDASYNPLCLSMDTRIPLLDGRTLTVEELSKEYQQGKENWAYSCDPITGKVVPGNITWAGVTRKNAEVIKITFDNGKELICTPDHKIPVWSKGFVEAQHLTPADSLISFERQYKPLSSGKRNDYEMIFDHSDKKWTYTHRMVGDFFRKIGKHQQFTFLPENVGAAKTVIHHKDFNRYNNDPRNLTFMNKEDHMAYHFFNRKEYWKNITEEMLEDLSKKISSGLKRYFANMTPEQKENFREMRSETNKKWIKERNLNRPEDARLHYERSGKGRSKYLRENPEARKKFLANARTYAENYPNATFVPSFEMLQLLAETAKEVGGNRITVLENIDQVKYRDIVLKTNPIVDKTNDKISRNKMTDRQLKTILKTFNYRNWKDFVAKLPQFNHRIVSIEKLDNIDTGTITIDGPERWHDYHTFAIESGIFIKNSMLDDYFFAQSSDGRGSKVEVLPSGDALGEITDLTYFTKKMARGLRIPTSYLSLGDDEQPASYNDGKLGQAMIQEYRFNKFCMRLQSLLSPVFDRFFKDYLEVAGIQFEDDAFELQFNPPQNFTKYRQIELDLQQTQVYSSVAGNKVLSERFKLRRFLNLTEEEILQNETEWMEENPDALEATTGSTAADQSSDADLGSVGFGGDDSFDLAPMDMGDGDMGGEELGGDIPDAAESPAPTGEQ
jgi:hypothetical protein